MTIFSRTSCAAFTWDSTGECRGVLVQGRGDRVRVRAFWQAKAGPDSSVAECLRDGFAALGAGDSTLVVAGAADAACGLAEVEVPALKTTELRAALGFELARHCPLPSERVAWGYRVLPGNAKRTRLPARIFYLRQAAWERWIEAVGGLKLDAIVPPAAVLDPLLADVGVVLPVSGGESFLLSPDGHGGRTVAAADGKDDGAPAAWACVQPGPLAQLPPGEQASFAVAVLLGAYGVSSGFQADRAGGLPVPYNLQPRRNVLNRFLAAAMVAAIVVLVAVAFWREYAARSACLEALRRENADVQREIDSRSKAVAATSEGALDVLAKEMREANLELSRPSLAAVLVELTETIGTDSWSYKFDWRDGGVAIEIEEGTEDVDLIGNLENSPLIGDVVEQSRASIRGRTSRKIMMNALWDQLAEPDPGPQPTGAAATEPPAGEKDEPVVTRVPPPPGAPPRLPQKETP